MTTLKFNCPMCSQTVEADFNIIGHAIQCPNCQKFIRIPSPPSLRMAPSALPTISACAIWSLVLSILNILFGVLAGIPAIICGHVGLARIKRSEGRLIGQGLCTAGLIIGYISTVFWLGVLLFFWLGQLS